MSFYSSLTPTHLYLYSVHLYVNPGHSGVLHMNSVVFRGSCSLRLLGCGVNVRSVSQALLERTNYTLDVTTGQRKYGGPPPESVYTGSQPTIGTEVTHCSWPFFVHGVVME